jgi:hypothetical protein
MDNLLSSAKLVRYLSLSLFLAARQTDKADESWNFFVPFKSGQFATGLASISADFEIES